MSLTVIPSNTIVVDRPILSVFEYLKDLRNYEKLMPADVESFEADSEKATLRMKGLGAFQIRKGQTTDHSLIVLEPQGSLPFQFNIEWRLSEEASGKTAVVGQINAQLNVFMKMMAESKLLDFVTSQADKMKSHLEANIEPE